MSFILWMSPETSLLLLLLCPSRTPNLIYVLRSYAIYHARCIVRRINRKWFKNNTWIHGEGNKNSENRIVIGKVKVYTQRTHANLELDQFVLIKYSTINAENYKIPFFHVVVFWFAIEIELLLSPFIRFLALSHASLDMDLWWQKELSNKEK